ncbi:conserved hypothetical protein [Streptomyces misionensis JCM 4497]
MRGAHRAAAGPARRAGGGRAPVLGRRVDHLAVRRLRAPRPLAAAGTGLPLRHGAADPGGGRRRGDGRRGPVAVRPRPDGPRLPAVRRAHRPGRGHRDGAVSAPARLRGRPPRRPAAGQRHRARRARAAGAGGPDRAAGRAAGRRVPVADGDDGVRRLRLLLPRRVHRRRPWLRGRPGRAAVRTGPRGRPAAGERPRRRPERGRRPATGAPGAGPTELTAGGTSAPPPVQSRYRSRSSIFRTFPETVIGKESRIVSLLGTL